MSGTTTTWYVATLTRYVLVDALDESTARVLGLPLLGDLCADLTARNPGYQVAIRTVRPATPDEIDLWIWHHEMEAREHRAMTDL